MTNERRQQRAARERKPYLYSVRTMKRFLRCPFCNVTAPMGHTPQMQRHIDIDHPPRDEGPQEVTPCR